MKPLKIHVSFLFVLLLPFTLGCIAWEPGWKMAQAPAVKGDVSKLLAQANIQISGSDTKEKLAALIRTYEQVLAIDPVNYESLWSLGRYYMLMGMGYSNNIKDKKENYLNARRYCERGMYTNSGFKKLVDDGAPVADACSALTKREIEAMYYWYNSTALYYMECMNFIEKIFNLRPANTKKVLDCMMAIDPAWGGGHPYAAIAGYYAAIPSFFGGDLKKSSEYYRKADEAGPEWLYIRFGRAMYLHRKTKDREAFRKDLQWIIAQDPHRAKSPYPWNVYFQREAKRMLADIDKYF